jgi:hypothetical protein
MHRTTFGLAQSAYKQLLPPCRSTRSTTKTDQTLETQLHTYLHYQHTSYPSRLPQNTKMSFLLPGFRRGLMLSTPFILSAPLLAYQFRNAQLIRCDGPDPFSKITHDLTGNYTTEARTPIVTQSGAVNPQAIRQISMGSILGVIGGLGISLFSKPLAVLIGLGVFVLQVSLSSLFHDRTLSWEYSFSVF